LIYKEKVILYLSIFLILLTSGCFLDELSGNQLIIKTPIIIPHSVTPDQSPITVEVTSTSTLTPSEIVPSTTQRTPSSSDASETQIASIDRMTLIYIPAGEFQMGSEDAYVDESPLHNVFLNSFLIDQNEVTLNQFKLFMEETNYSADPWGKGDDYPVTNVNWTDAEAYCIWAGRRLPTEAEWEKAARGGLESRKFPWGDEDPVCVLGADNGAQYNDCDGETVKVRSFAPNGYELYDMVGNVWEWVADWYAPDYYLNSPYENPLGPISGEHRVMRGGSWNFYREDIRTAYRGWYIPQQSLNDIGFRCASEKN
jgi:formylglycine-generating enzyme required for sulfatase activity